MTQRDVTSWLPNLLGPTDFEVDGAPQSLPKRSTLNLKGGFSVTDNPTNDSTDIAINALGSVVLTGTPTSGQVPTATGANTATWQTPSGGGGTVPTGTGIATTTSGAFDAAATGYGDLSKVAGSIVVAALSSASAIAVATALTFGTNPASSGYIRAPKAGTVIAARNVANTGDFPLVSADGADGAIFGDGNAVSATLSAGTSLFGYLDTLGGNVLQLERAGSDYISFGANPASAGAIQLANTLSIQARNAANSADIPLLGTDGSNNINLGDSAAAQGALTVINGKTGLSLKSAGVQIGSLAAASGDFLSLGAVIGGSSRASAGYLRLSDVILTAQNIITGRNNGGTADVSIIKSDGGGNTIYGDPGQVSQFMGYSAQLINHSLAYLSVSGTSTCQLSGLAAFTAYTVGTAPFVFDSPDNSVTSWDLKINSVALASITPTQFVTKKGLNRAVRRTATSTTLTASDDIVIFSASGQTATLPSAPAVGDKYTVGLDAAGTSNTYAIYGNGKTCVFQGTSSAANPAFTFTTATFTGANSSNVMSAIWTGAFYLITEGY